MGRGEIGEIAIDAESAEAEDSLVDAAVDGDVQAFAVLYDKHLERVYRYIYYRVRNQLDAEDLSQQVFLQAWRAISRYSRRGVPFIGWLLTIAHNLTVNHLRKHREADPLEAEPAAAGRWIDPEATAMARSDEDAVHRAILRLKPDHQQVILLRFVEHFSCSEVAAVLGKSEVNVRVMQHRALAELRRLLDREGVGA